jgi:hypothetical protein
MIADVIRSGGWAQAGGSGAPHSLTVTMAPPRGTLVRAQAQLARAARYSYSSDPWSAYAFIREWCFGDAGQCVLADDPEFAPSFITVFDATRITFEVRVTGPLTYGYLIATLFIYG